MKEDPFRVQRDFIIECLRDIDEQKERILQLVDEACEILKAIIDTETVDILKGMHFDNVVRQARVQIKSCRRRLDTAEQKICELSTKMTTIKWFSRTFRYHCLGTFLLLFLPEIQTIDCWSSIVFYQFNRGRSSTAVSLSKSHLRISRVSLQTVIDTLSTYRAT